MNTIAITGASGFIGKYLVAELVRIGNYEVRVLSRDKQRDLRKANFGHEVEIYEGDLSDSESLKNFLLPGCTVINLVYLWDGGEKLNLACMHNLLVACKARNVSRLIHCSTAAVAGRSPVNHIDEETQCLPISEYGRIKLKIEQDIINAAKGNFEAVILRPTSVYGIEGEPLKKLAGDLSKGSRWKNYLKSCLFGRRRMNLVHVANVVAATIFLIQYSRRIDGEIFIISDDDDPKNNFIDVERILMNELGIQAYRLPQLLLPLFVLKLMLIMLGRNNTNPRCDFDPGKLRKLGFNNPMNLSDGLVEYTTWYRETYLGEKGLKAS
ncbi:MAG: NAD-dependent epimerase/dehydratase family protein [Gallionellaceae bacterium]